MPIPKITDQLIASTKPCVPGWSLLVLEKIPRAQSAKTGNSVNYFFDFVAIAGPNNSEENKDRGITYMVSGSGLEAGIAEVSGPYLQLMCALTGLTAEQLNGADIDDSVLVGKQVWADIGKRSVEGKEYNDFKCFVPANEIPF
jgi:hypothetical protein